MFQQGIYTQQGRGENRLTSTLDAIYENIKTGQLCKLNLYAVTQKSISNDLYFSFHK